MQSWARVYQLMLDPSPVRNGLHLATVRIVMERNNISFRRQEINHGINW